MTEGQGPGGRVTRRIGYVATVLIVLGSIIATASPASAAPPPAPTNFAASTPNDGDTTFTWTPAPGATGHSVLCELQGFTDVATGADGVTGHASVRLPSTVGMLCSVRAYVSPGPVYSDYSNFVVVAIPAIPKPTGVTAVPYSGAVTVTWTKPACCLIDGWKITSTPASETRYVSSLEAASTVFSSLPVNVPHTFTVTPYRSSSGLAEQDGPSTTTAAVTVKPPPGAPTVVDVTSSSHHIFVKWTPPTSTGGSPITGYRIVGSRAENAPFSLDVPATMTSVRIDGVPDAPGVTEPTIPPGQEYEGLTVYAKNANGYGPGGAYAGGSVFTYDPSSPVRNLFVRVSPGYPVFVDWDEPATVAPDIGSVTYYVDIVGPTPTYADLLQQTQASLETPFTPGWYQARVRATGGLGLAEWATRWFAVGTPCDATFSDVTGPPFCTPISWAARSGIANGFAGGTFQPTQAVSRQAMAAFLYRTKGSPRGANPTCAGPAFPDVPASNPFCGVIDWMVDEGIAGGYADGGFHPNAAVSRQAAAAFLYRAGSQTGDGPVYVCSSAPFPDVPVAHPFCGYIAWMLDASITAGYADGGFHPTDPVSRQSMAAFLYRWHV